MNSYLEMIEKKINNNENKTSKSFLENVLQIKKGGYGEGDILFYTKIPEIRKLAKAEYLSLSMEDIKSVLTSKIHEVRYFGLCVIVLKMGKEKSIDIKKEILKIYLDNTKYINNWDLVDISAPNILGYMLYNNLANKDILYKLCQSSNIWENRIAIISMMYYIKKGIVDLPIKIIDLFLNDKRDLINKAVGWMLREIGKVNEDILIKYIKTNIDNIPRITLSYATEKITKELKKDIYCMRK